MRRTSRSARLFRRSVCRLACTLRRPCSPARSASVGVPHVGQQSGVALHHVGVLPIAAAALLTRRESLVGIDPRPPRDCRARAQSVPARCEPTADEKSHRPVAAFAACLVRLLQHLFRFEQPARGSQEIAVSHGALDRVDMHVTVEAARYCQTALKILSPPPGSPVARPESPPIPPAVESARSPEHRLPPRRPVPPARNGSAAPILPVSDSMSAAPRKSSMSSGLFGYLWRSRARTRVEYSRARFRSTPRKYSAIAPSCFTRVRLVWSPCSSSVFSACSSVAKACFQSLVAYRTFAYSTCPAAVRRSCAPYILLQQHHAAAAQIRAFLIESKALVEIAENLQHLLGRLSGFLWLIDQTIGGSVEQLASRRLLCLQRIGLLFRVGVEDFDQKGLGGLQALSLCNGDVRLPQGNSRADGQ